MNLDDAIASVEALHLEDDDQLVVRLQRDCSQAEIHAIAERFSSAFPGRGLVILPTGIELEAVTVAQMNQA